MDEIFTSLIMGEIHNEDILIKDISENSILFISQKELNETESIILRLYNLEESSYEQFTLVNCKIYKMCIDNTYYTFKADIISPCERLKVALCNIKEFSKQRNYHISRVEYSKLDFLKNKKPIYPTAQDKNIYDFKNVSKEWFEFTIDYNTNEKYKKIAKQKEIAFALNTDYLMQKCRDSSYKDIYYATLKKYHLENHGLLEAGNQRVYIGNEFCQNLLPCNHILEYINKANDEDYEVTVMLSVMDESMVKRIICVIDEIEQYCVINQKKIEIIVNDWGVLNYIKSNTSMIVPVLGRLLNKRIKDPRRRWTWHDKNDESLRSNCLSNNDYFRKFVNEYGVERFEFEVYENKEDVKSLILKGNMNSLHFPFYQMMTSLYCPLFYEYNNFVQNRLMIHNCPHICKEIVRTYSRDLRMIGIGNSNFVYVKDILTDPDILEIYCNNGIDRLVFSPII